jgi:hypothetical protein
VAGSGSRTELAARILALTGRQAVAGVDGVTFRLDHRCEYYSPEEFPDF